MLSNKIFKEICNRKDAILAADMARPRVFIKRLENALIEQSIQYFLEPK